jgi:hypothetical protein
MKKPQTVFRSRLTSGFIELDGTAYFARSQAACANVSFPDSPIIIDSYCLYIRIPFSSGVSIRVRNSVSRSLTFSTNFTFSGHLPAPPFCIFRFDASVIITQAENSMQVICSEIAIKMFEKQFRDRKISLILHN